MSSVTVTMNDGKKNEVTTLTEEEIDKLQADPDTASRKVIVDHLKALNCPVTEIIKMKEAARKEWILKAYAELGASAKPSGKGKAKLTSVKGGSAAAPKEAVKEQEQEDDDDDEDDEPVQAQTASKPAARAASSAAPSGDFTELKKLIIGLGQQVNTLQQTVNELTESVGEAKSLAQGQLGFLLDAHFIIRSLLPTAAGFDADDLPALKDDNYGKLVVEPDEVDADEGNG